ncbi:MAG: alcohol dehydrogenase catalytic domain-containing protein [Rhodospirillaceae bacterium]|jgi:D-arabinose 1-dehydrogenase-like Zn-dependent alcohol dehydrogenase|nr:alcohol dehydrogenase catalytic domain-containing protein [Rhodospirillaceae bacterium]
MRSYCITAYGGPLHLVEDETPAPEGDEVLIEIAGCGVCHSDVHIRDGYFDLGGGNKADLSWVHQLPFTLGHEIAGTVSALGSSASGAAVGNTVVVYPWIGCGQCDHCRSGEEQLCAKPRNLGINLAGGYASHVIVPHARYLFSVGDTPLELAATYACSGLTAFGALKKLKHSAEGKSLVIIGAGGVGLAGVMIAQAMMDTEIIVVDIDAEKRDAALAAGAAYAIDPTEKDARKQLYKLTGGAMAVADFVGSDKTVKFGFSALATGGELVVVGLFGGAVEMSVPMFPLKSLTVMGSYVGSPTDFGELMDMVALGKVKPLPVATRPLDEAEATLSDLADGKIVGRVVLTP